MTLLQFSCNVVRSTDKEKMGMKCVRKRWKGDKGGRTKDIRERGSEWRMTIRKEIFPR
jgi:hypothetical protein